MNQRSTTLADVDVSSSISLSVGWKSGTKTQLAQLLLGSEVATVLRSVASAAIEQIADKEGEPWAPDADLSQETFLYLTQTELGEAPVLGGRMTGTPLAQALSRAEDLEALSPRKLPASDIQFYAITLGDEPGNRAVFLRRVNPRRGLRGGKLLTSYHDVLVAIDDPVFAFDEYIDVVFFGDRVYVLSQTAFMAIFRAQDSLMAQIPQWSAQLASHVPISVDGQERLTARAIRDSRLRVRLESIVKRGHLVDVPSKRIRKRMTKLGLDQERLLDSTGMLEMQDDDIPIVLQFLNEDLFPGALTGMSFRADKKAAR